MGGNMELLKGKMISDRIRERTEKAMASFTDAPCLVIVRVGDNPDDIAYENGAAAKLKKWGIDVESRHFPVDISTKELAAAIKETCEDGWVSGILIMKPLPAHINDGVINDTIYPYKDVDGISLINKGLVLTGGERCFAPCTAQAVVELLKGYDIPLKGKKVTIVGRSSVVGKPLAMLLLKEDATVTVCHTKTADLKKECQEADILVVAAGRAGLIDKSYIRDHTVVIDVGINVDAEGNLCGDVDMTGMEDMDIRITPVPGGIGTVTTAVLAENVVKAAAF